MCRDVPKMTQTTETNQLIDSSPSAPNPRGLTSDGEIDLSAVRSAGLSGYEMTPYGVKRRRAGRIKCACKGCRKMAAPRGIYCSASCRNKAYRQRKAARSPKVKKETKPAIVGTCLHCGNSFWGKSDQRIYCSASCKVMASRARRAAAVAVLALAADYDHAFDAVERLGSAAVCQLLQRTGYLYDHRYRRWYTPAEIRRADAMIGAPSGSAAR